MTSTLKIRKELPDFSNNFNLNDTKSILEAEQFELDTVREIKKTR